MFEFLFEDLIGVALWELSEVVAMVVFLANTFTIWLPNHSDNKYLQWVLNLLNRLSLNVLRNANRLQQVLEHDAVDEQQHDEKVFVGKMQRKVSRRAGGKP